MANGKFFTDKTKDLIVDVLDGLKNWGILEPIEKPLYRIVLNQVDKYADKVVPDVYDDKINELAQMALAGDYVEAAGLGGEIIDDLVNFEKLDDSVEKLIFVDGLKFIVRQIILYIEKKKEEE